MNCTRTLRNQAIGRRIALALLIAVITLTVSDISTTYASNDRPGEQSLYAPMPPEQQEIEGRSPEAQLPFLFAVFFLTWAVFFAYAFVLSRRQREMLREIEALKRALIEKEDQKPIAEMAVRPRRA